MSHVNDMLREVDRRDRRAGGVLGVEAIAGGDGWGGTVLSDRRSSKDAPVTPARQWLPVPVLDLANDNDPDAYLRHFRLQHAPFVWREDGPPEAVLASCQVALNALRAALSADRGLAKITGAAGTGKSLLCRQLLSAMGPAYQTVYMARSPGSLRQFLQELVTALPELPGGEFQRAHSERTDGSTPNSQVLFDELKLRLRAVALEGKRAVLCIDEAQRLPRDLLELLWRLSEVSVESRKFVHVLFVGRPQLDQRLRHESLRALKQKFTSSHVLMPMSMAEINHYIDYRMASAGYYGARATAFTQTAKWLIRWHTGGTPGLVNAVADNALKAAFRRRRTQVSAREVLAATEAPDFRRLRAAPSALAGLGLAGAISCLVSEVARIV